MDLADQGLAAQLGYYLELNPGLLRLDLSGSRLLPSQLATLMECLDPEVRESDSPQLQYLGLGYIGVSKDSLLKEFEEKYDKEHAAQAEAEGKVIGEAKDDEEAADAIVASLCSFISSSKSLLHLDLAGMNLRERIFAILESVQASESQTLASIHLHDNQFSLEQKDRILRVMGIETNKYHHLHDRLNLQEHDAYAQAILSRRYTKHGRITNRAHKFFKGDTDSPGNKQQPILRQEKQFQLKILNNEINQELKESRKQINTDVYGGHSREVVIKDPMILTRKIGQPELVFNEKAYCGAELNAANAEERWSYNDSINGDDCYVCQQYSYVQVFFTREKAHLDFQKLEDPELREILKDAYDLDSNESLQRGAPILLSSVNNWVLTRFLDVKVFS